MGGKQEIVGKQVRLNVCAKQIQITKDNEIYKWNLVVALDQYRYLIRCFYSIAFQFPYRL